MLEQLFDEISACPLQKLAFEEWHPLPEPNFFSDTAINEQKLSLMTEIGIANPSAFRRVKLLKVNDRLFKLNGSARKYLWENGLLEIPSFLYAEVYEINEKDFFKLVKLFDKCLLGDQDISKNIKSALSSENINFKNTKLNSGQFKEALDMALRGVPRRFQYKSKLPEIDPNYGIAIFRKELLLIDKFKLSNSIFFPGVMAGALVMLGNKYPVSGFIRNLSTSTYIRNTKGLLDPVGALLRTIEEYRGLSSDMKSQMAVHLFHCTLQAMECWVEGEGSKRYWRARRLNGANVSDHIKRLKIVKGIVDDKEM